MTPVVSVRSRPNGLPIASAGSPTSTSFEEPSFSAWRSRPSGSTSSSARSVDGSVPATFAVAIFESENFTLTVLASPTTWAFVTIEPPRPMTNPEPEASPVWPSSLMCARMKTTPGASRL